MPSAQQSNFLDLCQPAEGEHKVEVAVRREGKRYIATIGGGWWAASGETREIAVKRVLDAYTAEMEHY